MAKWTLSWFAFGLLVLVNVSVPCRGAPRETAQTREYVCRLLAQPPELDGDVLGDPAWGDAAAGDGYHDLRTGLPSERQTSFRIGFTVDAVFLGVVCDEPEPDGILADLPDGENFELEDGLALYLALDDGALMEFLVNAAGSRTSTRTLKNWQAAVKVGNASWSAEIALPWEVIGACPAEGVSWRFNVCRFFAWDLFNECSTWAALEYRTDETANYGRLLFEGLGAAERAAITERIASKAIKEEILVYSRPKTGVMIQSEYSENLLVYSQGAYVAPRLSPDGRRVLINSVEGGALGVWIVSRDGGRKERVCDGSQAAWSLDGAKIVFQRDGRIVERTLATGDETVVSPEDVPPLAFPAYMPGSSAVSKFLCVDEAGQGLRFLNPAGDKPLDPILEGEVRGTPRCSPDGTTIAVQKGARIWLLDVAAREARLLTAGPGVQAGPVWADDGKSLCYVQLSSPTAVWGDICRVKIDTPHVVDVIQRKAYPSFDWRGSELAAARTRELPGATLVLRRTDATLDLSGDLKTLQTAAWEEIPEGGPGGNLHGSVLVENDWFGLCFAAEGAFLFPKTGAVPAGGLRLRLTNDAGLEAAGVSEIRVVEWDNAGVSFRVGFATESQAPLAATITVPRRAPTVSIQTQDGVGRAGVSGDFALAVSPDRLSNDLIVSPGRVAAGATTALPKTPFVLGCVADSDALVVLVSRSGDAVFTATNAADAKSLTSLDASLGDQGVVIGVLTQGKPWQAAELEEGAVTGAWQAKWKRPFHAVWRMAVGGPDAAYARMWNVRSLGALSGRALPVDRTFDAPPDAAVVYLWGREKITAPDVWTTTDVLADAWGIDRYLSLLDVQGVRGSRSGSPPTAFRELAMHGTQWHPAQASNDYGNFGVLEIMGSVFAVDTDGVREFLAHLGGDALALIRGLDERIGEYETFADEIVAFCQAHQADDADGTLAAIETQAQRLRGSEIEDAGDDLAQAAKALQRVQALIGVRDGLTLPMFEAFCCMPGNDAWARIYEEFLTYVAAKEGRLWHNNTIRFELWYEDDFRRFYQCCVEALERRQRVLAGYRQWAQQTRDAAGRWILTHPESSGIAEDLRERTQAILRNRYFQEGDWRGEEPLARGVLQ
ncbi:MAG: hypothetical protein GWP08_07860 [Nitrospiraceae bacterium]|nr:hypothetical protein [Nitrospiraceae bacterium]